MKRLNNILLTVGLAASAWAQVDLAPVTARPVMRTIELPGELAPFQSVSLSARVQGYVERMLVDRGSRVRQGELLVQLSAPEVKALIAEAEAKKLAAESGRLQAEAELAGAESTLARLRRAAETPGAIAGNELTLAEKQADASRAAMASRQQESMAAAAALRSQQDMESYLQVTAPFDGVVTDRLVHPGALVGPGGDSALLVIQQVSRLRLVVAVPEVHVSGVARGARLSFRVPACPGKVFHGIVARSSQALDTKTRTMAVELDVPNPSGELSPGMYPTVSWMVRRTAPALFVPRTSIVTTSERTFVVKDQDGRAIWVDVRAGAAEGDTVEVLGDLRAGDKVLRRGTDEFREGTAIQAKAR